MNHDVTMTGVTRFLERPDLGWTYSKEEGDPFFISYSHLLTSRKFRPLFRRIFSVRSLRRFDWQTLSPEFDDESVVAYEALWYRQRECHLVVPGPEFRIDWYVVAGDTDRQEVSLVVRDWVAFRHAGFDVSSVLVEGGGSNDAIGVMYRRPMPSVCVSVMLELYAKINPFSVQWRMATQSEFENSPAGRASEAVKEEEEEEERVLVVSFVVVGMDASAWPHLGRVPEPLHRRPYIHDRRGTGQGRVK